MKNANPKLLTAYSMKRSAKPKMMAEGGMVDEEDMVSTEEDSDLERDLPQMAEGMSLAASIMKDRRRQKMAEGGMVEEMDAPEEDGRGSRGLNLEPVHTIEDEEHETSEPSLAQSILQDRKKSKKK